MKDFPMKLKMFLVALLCLGLNTMAFKGQTLSPQKTSPVVAFVGVNVIAADREQVLQEQTVIVRGEQIAEIGPVAKIKVPKGALRINGRGKYLTPGLVDMHAHLNSPKELPLYLANGVTTVYNLNGRPAHLKWREEIKRGAMVGPNIYTCGPTIRVLNKAEDARRIIEEQHKAGYDSIKIYNWVTKEAYEVLIEEARKRDMLFVGHIAREPGFDGTLKAGQAIAHAEEFVYTFFDNKVDDDSRLPQIVQRTRESGVVVVATLVAFDHIIRQAENLPALLATPEMKYLAPWVRSEWSPEKNLYKKRFANPEGIAYLNKSLALQKKLVKALHQAGVRILTGTDAMNMGVVPGFSLHEELRNLVELGLTPFEAIQAGTRHPAEFLSRAGTFGTIAVGKRADMVLVEANPLEDISRMARPAGVMVRGRWLPQAELRRMLDEVSIGYAKEESFVKNNLAGDPLRVLRYLDDNDPFNNLLTKVGADIVLERGMDEFRKLYREIKRVEPQALIAQEAYVNSLGYLILPSDRKKAIDLFELNVESYPKSANVYDSLAEAYLADGRQQLAIKYYEKALEVDPDYPNAKTAAELIKKLKGEKEGGQHN
jgi:imidazolonepropionase-like amidohydrolase